MRTFNCTAMIVATVTLVNQSAFAQADSLESRMREQLRSTTTQLRDLQASQASLQAAKDAAEKDRDALKAKLSKAGSGGGADSKQLAALRRDIADLRVRNDALAVDLRTAQTDAQQSKNQLTQATSEAARKNKQDIDAAHAEATAATTALTNAKTLITACDARNTQLVGIANEILDKYQHVGIGTALGRREPFIGLKRVQLENAAEVYGNRIYDSSVHSPLDQTKP